jgi:drug/metabolite transporter (DMT)-like permease
MIFLFLALFFSLCIMVTFKVFPKYKISVVQAITVNYFVCALLGFSTLGVIPSVSFVADKEWLYVALLSGLFLILVFNVFAQSAEKAGVAITAVSSKMSVIIPVLLGTILFGEQLPLLKIVGVALVMFSFYLIFKKRDGYSLKLGLFVLPLLLFFGNGTNDSILKYAQFHFITTDQGYVEYLSVAFGFSFILGLFVLLVKTITGKEKLIFKNVVAGIWLGTCNWYSTLFFLKGLGQMDVSVFIPVFNAGLVSLAAIIGMIVFKEKFSKLNIAGIVLSIIAITIIAYAG